MPAARMRANRPHRSRESPWVYRFCLAKNGRRIGSLWVDAFQKGANDCPLGIFGSFLLVNRLLQEERSWDVRGAEKPTAGGRHTTTSRDLFLLPNGAMIIDTPVCASFSCGTRGKDQIYSQCRFSDCQHRKEPGCAVQEAIAGRSLVAERLESWRKLQRERSFSSEKSIPKLALHITNVLKY